MPNFFTHNQKELREVKNFLFYLTIIWSLTIFAMSWVEFLFGKFHISNPLVYGYLILLSAYIANKEANRWNDIEMQPRSGQFFVYLWWLNLLTMYILSFSIQSLEVSSSVQNITYDITAGLIISEISKILKIKYNQNVQHPDRGN